MGAICYWSETLDKSITPLRELKPASAPALLGFHVSSCAVIALLNMQSACLQNDAFIMNSPESQRSHGLIQSLPSKIVDLRI